MQAQDAERARDRTAGCEERAPRPLPTRTLGGRQLIHMLALARYRAPMRSVRLSAGLAQRFSRGVR